MRVKLTIVVFCLSLIVAAGQNLEVQYPFDYTTAYQDVYVASDGRGFAVGTCGILASTENGSDWTVGTAPSTTLGESFTMVACAPGTNCQDVWLGTNQELLHSTDGGQNWDRIAVESLDDPREMHFLDANTLVISHSSTSILRSTDGGQTWTEVVLPGAYRGAIEFVTPDLAFLPDLSNYNMLRSTDQGVTWDSIYHFDDRPFYLDMVDANLGYLIIGTRKLLKTTTGGLDWTVVQERVNATPRVIVAFDENNLMLSSFPSSLVLSNDGGQTWDNIPQPLEEDAYGIRLNSLHRVGDEVWIASDASTLLYSTDRLTTRTNLFPADRESIQSIQFVDANTGYALCERRGFFKTTDGGDNWERVLTTFGTVSRDMLVRSATDIIIPYNSSGPQRSLDGGETWTPLLPEAIEDTISVFQIDELPGGRLYLMGSIHGAYSDDDGQTWTPVYHGLGGGADMLYFYDDQLGFAGGQGGRLARTTDGGASWTAILRGDLTNQPIRNIFMRDNLNGFINISSTTYCTDDGGLSWSSSVCNGYNPPALVTVAPDGRLYSEYRSGEEQVIAVSADQGQSWQEIERLCTRSHRILGISPDSRRLYGGWSGSLITRLELSATATKEQALEPTSLRVFPNPSSGATQVQLPAELDGQDIYLRLYNANGQIVQQRQLREQYQAQVELQNLPPGFYFLEVRSVDFYGRAKLIKN